MYSPPAGPFCPVVAGRRRVFAFHRANGAGGYAPNSLAAIEACVAVGAPRVEVDIQFLADDAMLVLHDELLEGETTGAGPVHAASRADIRRLCYRDEGRTPLCFLEDVVDVVRGSTTMLQVDLKAEVAMSAARGEMLADVLRPVGDRLIVGSMAHWNLRPLAAFGLPVALDPTLHWHAMEHRAVGDGLNPARQSFHGYWDDAPFAHMQEMPFADYLLARLDDLCALLPAEEWMVNIATIRHTAERGVALGDELRKRGLQLAAWTLNDRGPETGETLGMLFEAGVTTVITDTPGPLGALADEMRAAEAG